MATDFAINLRRFLTDHMAGLRGCSPNTISSYRDTFKLLICFMCDEQSIPPERLTLDHLDVAAVTAFLAWLRTERRNRPSTCNQRLAAISSFYRWLQTQDPARMACCQDILQIPASKHDQPAIAHLTVEQTRQLLALPDRSTRQGRRDATLLATLYDTAARVQELADLTVRHPARGPRNRRADRQRPQNQARPDRRQHGGAARRLPRRARSRPPRP
jgi:integrase/recombinase XerD